jgi:hypothetical protein
MSSSAARANRANRRDRQAGRTLRDFHRFATRNGGIFEAFIFRREYSPAIAPTPHGHHVFGGIDQWLAMADQARAGSGPLCLGCKTEFGPDNQPAAFCVSRTLNREPMVVLTGICTSCSSKPDGDLLAIARRRFREKGLIRD